MGLLGALKAKVLARVHPNSRQRQHHRHAYAGWQRQRRGARREGRAKFKLSVRNFASRVVTNPRVVDANNQFVTVGGKRYQPDLAIVRGFGRLRWAELVEVSTAGEYNKWLHPNKYPGEHKSRQRKKCDTLFQRPGRIYLRNGGTNRQGDQMVRIFKSGPLAVKKPGHVHFQVER